MRPGTIPEFYVLEIPNGAGGSDPPPGAAWKLDQFWVCPRCGRHFWTTHPATPDATSR